MKTQTSKKAMFCKSTTDGNLCAAKTPRAAIVLSGSGVYDGSEIHEAVITLLNLQRLGVEVSFFAPDVEQRDTINHLDMSTMGVPRNVLVESARIARGNIEPLSKYDANKFDMLIFVGGFGAAKNLCSFAYDGADCIVNKDVAAAIIASLTKKTPMAFMCISPVIAAKVIGSGVKLTIGNDTQTAATIEKMGAVHVNCPADGFVKDDTKNIYSTPAYMLAQNTAQIDKGVGDMIESMLKQC